MVAVATVAEPVAPDGATPDTPELPSQVYLDEYDAIWMHTTMLQDPERMRAYYDAIRLNAETHFRGKVVLDVGTGTGILSIWAAQAGARRVYAVEATRIATHAERMFAAHGFAETITMLRGRIEELPVPEPVDVIVSEWMGYFLLRESMVESVLYARDRWLRPGGVMYPSSAQLMIAAFEEAGLIEYLVEEVRDAYAQWTQVTDTALPAYGLNFTSLNDAYWHEVRDYSFGNAWQGQVHPEARIGREHMLLDVDMHTVTAADFFGWTREVHLQEASAERPVHALVGWFDVSFCPPDRSCRGAGAGEEGGTCAASAGFVPLDCVSLSTSPKAHNTHWAHTTFPLWSPLTSGTVRMRLVQSKHARHDLNFTLSYAGDGGTGAPDVEASFLISAFFRGSRSDIYTENSAG